MSVSRQNNLFLGQDWTVIYQAMSQVNFNSYDYDTVKQALTDYIRLNYSEDFNDWIESSEFVAIIDLLSYLAGSLAFRIDLNIRENFMDTATKRESILRLARMLSYQPRRCIAAQGLIKLTQITTDQNIYDSNGTNLANVTVIWNDVNNPDWYEQFVLVLNAAFLQSNPFGQPVKQGTVASKLTSRYDFNNTLTSTFAFPFSATVGGQGMNFEFCNIDFTTQSTGSITIGSSGYFSEKSPSVFNPVSLIYQNDGNGNASSGTGFFALFKQGTLGFTDYLLSTAVPNRIIDIGVLNVNQSDVWVQTVDDNGLPIINWTKVPAISNSNLVYNNLDRLTRNIYQVITTDSGGNDSISVKFGDGSFGNIPTGRIRVYYRTSNNQTYTILPQDLSSVPLALTYASDSTSVNTISMQFDLSTTVANSLARETSASIQQNAPSTYYTQNRMVNGEDYNVFPLRSSEALKVQSVARVYSGQSRYLDINDPTGQYQDTKVFSNDGIIYKDSKDSYIEIYNSLNLNATQIIDTVIQPILDGTNNGNGTFYDLRDFYLENYPRSTGNNISWQTLATGGSGGSSLGTFYKNGLQILLPDSATNIRAGSYIKFTNGVWSYILNEGNTIQTNYLALINGNIVTKNNATGINTGLTVDSIIPSFRTTLTSSEITAINTAIGNTKNFGLTYNASSEMWQVITSNNLAVDANFSLTYQNNTTNQNIDASWLIQFKYVNGEGWQVRSRGIQYVFESVQDVRFYYINTQPIIDINTGLAQSDFVKVLSVNPSPVTGNALGVDYQWSLTSQEVYPDGYIEPRRVRISFWNQNSNNVIDNPDQFDAIVNPAQTVIYNKLTGEIDQTTYPYVFWKSQNTNGFDYLVPTSVTRVYTDVNTMTSANPLPTTPALLSSTVWVNGDVVYVDKQKLFIQYQSTPPAFVDVTAKYKAAVGRGNISYLWQHFVDSNNRVDPALMNIIDSYVLTSSYDTALRNWISTGNTNTPKPLPPTPEQLRSTFSDFENYKMMTDQIIWHPVSYKILFGASADSTLKVTFKVVKNTGSNITDAELKSNIINNINNYFSLANWNFGDSFFFTELAAYIHQQNPTYINSIVIVPLSVNGQFGDLFEIVCDSDEIFISSARVTDIQIVTSLSASELRI
jgi:hypothetical protein